MIIKSVIWHQNINTINNIATSHGARIKKMLCANDEVASNITQIAVSHLKSGEQERCA